MWNVLFYTINKWLNFDYILTFPQSYPQNVYYSSIVIKVIHYKQWVKPFILLDLRGLYDIIAMMFSTKKGGE